MVEKDECPITKIEFVLNSQVSTFKANSPYTWKDEDYDSNYHILWSKDYDSLPVSNTALEKNPCMNPTESSIYDGFQKYPGERGIKSCTHSVTNGLTNDPRYINTGIRTNLGNLHADNGVINSLSSNFRGDFNANNEVYRRRQQELYLFTRPTLSWKLSCEADPRTSRTALYNAVSQPFEFPDRIMVAAIFAFICIGIEACACGCGIVGSVNDHGSYKQMTMARAAATICSGLFVANIVWMSSTGASILRKSKDDVAAYSIVNECGDNITNMPKDEINDRFDTGVEKATIASYFTYGLLVTYAISCIFILRQAKD